MGKKPFFSLIGLVWAGIALTGCGGDHCGWRHKERPFSGAPKTKSEETSDARSETKSVSEDTARPVSKGDVKPISAKESSDKSAGKSIPEAPKVPTDAPKVQSLKDGFQPRTPMD